MPVDVASNGFHCVERILVILCFSKVREEVCKNLSSVLCAQWLHVGSSTVPNFIQETYKEVKVKATANSLISLLNCCCF